MDGTPLADVIEELAGRELAVEVSLAVRSKQDTIIPVELHGREYSLNLRPLAFDVESGEEYFAAYWRSYETASAVVAGKDMHQALLHAKRRIRDLSRDDPITGLFNEDAFREILAHDWAVAEREKSTLALVCFTLIDLAAYRDVFGRHATDACIRRVGQAVRRFLRRASDVAARIGEDKLIVMSHASEKTGVQEFAERIAASVRELGLHHPRSATDKYVTLSYRVTVIEADANANNADSLLDDALK